MKKKALVPSNLIVVANRLPVHRVRTEHGHRWESSAGGLVTAMQPVLKRTKGTWVGWSGTAGRSFPPFEAAGIRIRPVGLSQRDVENFYHGMSNRTLWPLYHDAIRTPEFHRHWWKPYQEVNARFAKAAAKVARQGDVVWVHDYHLQLVPAMLRALKPKLKIGFFLHIPFPPDELFEWLPWRRELLEGLLGADVVGFHTSNAVRNFSRLVRMYTDAVGGDTQIEYQSRVIRVLSAPISIDTTWWEAQARRPEIQAKARELRKKIGSGRTIFLAVDRLDYTKGITARLNAFAEFLRTTGRSVDDCVLVQIAVPSREDVTDYAAMRDSVEMAVGRINGQFSVPGRVAVHYFRKNLSREDLVAYYRAADVMLVTPLRDGMNLVAKEYVATRFDNTGVLVLSQFAGAARELTRALLVNPRDLDQMVQTFHEAMDMPAEDQAMRMAVLRSRVKRHDVHEWADHFLGALSE